MNTLKKIIKVILNKFGVRIGGGRDVAAWADNSIFLDLFEDIKPHTLLGTDRLFMLWQYANSVKRIDGEVAQVGVYQGGSAKLISEVFKNTNKDTYLFDTFSGMPDVDSNIDRHKKGDFKDTSLDSVRNLFSDRSNVYFYPGVFPATSKPIHDKKFSFVYIDVDIYQSTKDSLVFFYPRMTTGGIIVLDDYQGKHTPGVKKALDEFLQDKQEIVTITAIGQCVLIKQ